MYEAKCSNCGRKRMCYRTSRYGGGSYKRGGRFYATSICGECATDLLQYITTGHTTVSRFGVSSIRQIAAKFAEEQSNG